MRYWALMNNRKKNILHVVLSLNVGGAERVVESIVLDNKKYFKQYVLCLDEIGTIGKNMVASGAFVRCRKRKPGIDFSIIFWLYKYCKKMNIDLIHAHGETPWFYSALTSALFVFPKMPCITTIHGYGGGDRKELKKVLLWKILSFLSSKVITVSKALKDELLNAGLPKKKLELIYNGISTNVCSGRNGIELRKTYNIKPKTIVVGVIARLSYIKNHTLLLKAMYGFKQIHRKSIILVVVGDGEQREILKKYVEELNLVNDVVFCGEHLTVKEFYNMFDVFILPSLSEGISMTILESMDAGVPVIASNVGGNNEIIDHMNNGLLFPSGNLRILIESIDGLINNFTLKKRIINNAKFKVNKMFNIDIMINNYTILYRSLAR